MRLKNRGGGAYMPPPGLNRVNDTQRERRVMSFATFLPSLKFSNRFMFLIFLAGLIFLYLAELEVFVIVSSSTGLAGDPNLGSVRIRLGLKLNSIS